MTKSFPPKYRELIEQAHDAENLVPLLRLLSWFGIGGEGLRTAISDIEGVREQLDDLVQLAVSFQVAFIELGWLFSESTNVETAKKALRAFERGRSDEAEAVLVADFEGERLDYVVMRMCNLSEFMQRKEQLVEAAELTREGRYLSATPLLLIVADGVGSDAFGKSIFAEGVELEELNSFAGQPDALPELIRNICQTRRKTSSEQLDFPFRNGIIHGRDLGYGNRLVNAKCWSLLGCIADVIEARNAAEALKPEPEPSLRDTLASHARSMELERQIKEWKPRPVIDKRIHVVGDTVSSLNEHEPEAALAEFLQAWKTGNYGRMAQMTLYFDEETTNRHAGEIRKFMEGTTLMDAEICRIEDEAPAVAMVTVDLKLCSEGQEYIDNFVFRMICQDGKGGAAVRGHEGAIWLIVEGYQSRWWGGPKSLA